MASTSNFAGISFDIPTADNSKKVCQRWTKTDRVFQSCNVSISQNTSGCVIFQGLVKNALRNALLAQKVYVQYWAASPPDYRCSFSGSGLPFPNEEMAYESSPNVGKVPLNNDGSFSFRLRFPNSYYKRLGAIYVKPNVKLLFKDEQGNMIGKMLTVTLGEGIPFRSLTFPRLRRWSSGPMFFCGREQLPVRTQAQILQDSGYPCVNEEPKNFWGLRPPVPEG